MQGSPPVVEIFLVSTLIMFGLVGFIIFFVVVYQLRLLRQQRLMQAQEAEYQRQLLTASIQSQEMERQRIARDLHDEIGAMLSTVKMKVSQAKRKSQDVEQLTPVLSETSALLTDSIQNVRRISHALLPPTLERFGLAAALSALFEGSQIEDGPVLSFQQQGPERRIPLDQELGLYRVVQEMLNNALKHAQAKHIRLQLERRPTETYLHLTDDGVGFSLPEAQHNAAGLGLKNIQSRILTLGGKWQLTSQPGQGTQLELSVPFLSPTD
ncbi:MAG: sensor histidine kinase [Bacteroidota bacterium]